MTTVTVSPKFQVVIPKEIRESLGLQPGEKLQVVAYKGRVELVPARSIREMRGRYQGIDTNIERDPDRL